jgi:hypothetical protein
MELLMALVAEGQGVDQDQFAAMFVPKMAPEAEPKPYNQKGRRGRKLDVVGVVYVGVSINLTDASPRSVPYIRCTYALTVVSFSGTGNPDFGSTYCGWGLHKGKS